MSEDKAKSKNLYNPDYIIYSERSKMIALKWLEELITYAVKSAYLKDERAVNLLIIANPETGKTELLRKFEKIPSCLYITDFTRFGFLRDYLTRFQSHELRTILVPDLIQLINSTNPNETKGAIGFLNALTEEGIQNISTYNVPMKLPEPVRANLIGCIPKSILQDHKRYQQWFDIGFISRMIPLTFDYTDAAVFEIQQYLYNEKYKKEKPLNFDVPKEDIDVKLKPDLAKKFEVVTTPISKKLGTYDFRLQRNLQVLAKAKALHEERKEVIEPDIKRIIELTTWMNLEFKPIGIKD